MTPHPWFSDVWTLIALIFLSFLFLSLTSETRQASSGLFIKKSASFFFLYSKWKAGGGKREWVLLAIIFTNDLLAFYLSAQASNTQRTFSDSRRMKVQSWNDVTGWLFLKRFRHDIKPQLQASTWMGSPGEISQSRNTAFTAAGRCLCQWSKQQYDKFSIENGRQTTESLPLGNNGKSWMRGKKYLRGPLKMLIFWQHEIYSHHGRWTQNQVLFPVLSLNLCIPFNGEECGAAALSMWAKSKELLISSKRAVNFVGGSYFLFLHLFLLLFLSVFLYVCLCIYLLLCLSVSSPLCHHLPLSLPPHSPTFPNSHLVLLLDTCEEFLYIYKTQRKTRQNHIVVEFFTCYQYKNLVARTVYRKFLEYFYIWCVKFKKRVYICW